ncbi:MAG TPA: PEP-CTERM sorting domain-containing protein [Phycisphaerae bacterium]|nr:PEP-CTERM sorting domain-containing protein [Phycisphaerae bacterium]
MDGTVDGTDLAILKTNFGFIALPSPGGVLEPATLSLLALGAAGLAAKRRRKS